MTCKSLRTSIFNFFSFQWIIQPNCGTFEIEPYRIYMNIRLEWEELKAFHLETLSRARRTNRTSLILSIEEWISCIIYFFFIILSCTADCTGGILIQRIFLLRSDKFRIEWIGWWIEQEIPHREIPEGEIRPFGVKEIFTWLAENFRTVGLRRKSLRFIPIIRWFCVNDLSSFVLRVRKWSNRGENTDSSPPFATLTRRVNSLHPSKHIRVRINSVDSRGARE